MLKSLKIFLQKKKMKNIGENVLIDKTVVFSNSNNISIGNNCYIGHSGSIYGLGGITIENSVIIGPRVIIYSSNHNYKEQILGRSIFFANFFLSLLAYISFNNFPSIFSPSLSTDFSASFWFSK